MAKIETAKDDSGNSAEAQQKTVRVAVLGFGTVGSAVARLLGGSRFPGIRLTHIYNRDIARKRGSEAARVVGKDVIWTESVDDVLHADVDLIVELLGGLNPTESWVRTALCSGKSVVTANKQLIAYKGAALARLAAKHGVQLIHGAAVAGGVPVIPGLLQGQSGDEIVRVCGIVNGTCNYMLSRMEAGADYAEVLADAQRLGYAEADPTADVDGLDARAKLCILSRIALRAELDPDEVPTQSIAEVALVDFHYAKELNCTIRQVSAAQWDGSAIQARVAPMLVPLTSPMAWSHGTQNMVVSTGRFGGDIVFSGRGAGGDPTAVAVVSDILAVAQGHVSVQLPTRRRAVSGDFLAPRYLRFVVQDGHGIIAAIAGALAAAGVSLDAILQRPGHDKAALPFVVTTEPCLNSTIEKALAAMAGFDFMIEPPICLQMLSVEA